jgi:hypothetical protein
MIELEVGTDWIMEIKPRVSLALNELAVDVEFGVLRINTRSLPCAIEPSAQIADMG